LVVAVLSLTGGELALACNVPPPSESPPPPATVRHTSRTKVKIRIKNYTTFGVGAGQGCACGLKRAGLGTIVSVDRARIVRAGTNTLVPGFPFTPNATTTASFNSLEPGTWQGFFAQTDASVPEGDPTDIIFDATVVDGSTDDDVAADLAGGTIGTGPANVDGTVDTTDPNHLGFAAPGNITNEKFAYVTNVTSNDITLYNLDATNGPLFRGPDSLFPAPGGPFSLAFVPRDEASTFDWVIVTNFSSNTISVNKADRDTGALTPNGMPGPSGGINPRDIVVIEAVPLGGRSFVYVLHQTSNNIGAHEFDLETGALTQIGSFLTGLLPQKFVKYNTAGNVFLGAVNCGGGSCDGPGSMSVFSANATTGLLTEVDDSPFPTGGTGTVWATRHHTNQWLAAAHAGSGTITVLRIDQITGSLTLAGPPVSSGGLGTSSAVFDPSGGDLIVTHFDSSDGMLFKFDPTDVSLTLTGSFPTGGMGTISTLFAPGSNFFFTSNFISDTVSGFALDSVTGNATSLPESPYASGGVGPTRLEVIIPGFSSP